MMPEEDGESTLLDLLHYLRSATAKLEGFGFALPLVRQSKFVANSVKNINELLNQIQDKLDS